MINSWIIDISIVKMLSPKKRTAFNKWKIELPSTLTEEELNLKAKYEHLKVLKQKLKDYQSYGIRFKENINKLTKSNKSSRMEQSDINSKRTSDFKKPSKQTLPAERNRPFPQYSFDDDSRPRSILVHGSQLTDHFLRETFSSFGLISKTRADQDLTSAVVSFSRPSSAQAAAAATNGKIANGQQLKVALQRPRNCSWTDLSAAGSTLVFQELSRGRTVHVLMMGILSCKDLEEVFQNVGRVTRIYLNNRKKFAFVTFESEEQAQRAVRECNHEIYKEVKLVVSPQFVVSPSDVKQHCLDEMTSREVVQYDDV